MKILMILLLIANLFFAIWNFARGEVGLALFNVAGVLALAVSLGITWDEL